MISITLPPFAFIIPRWDYSNKKGEIELFYSNRGIYVLYGEDTRVLYVGKSRKLYARIRNHIKGVGTSSEFSGLIAKIGVIPIEELAHLDIYETHAINTFMPEFNRDKVYYSAEMAKRYEFELLMAEGEYHRLTDEVAELEDDRRESSLAAIDYDLAHADMLRYKSRIAYLNGKLDEMGR